MNRLTSYRGVLQASTSEHSIHIGQKLSRHERDMMLLYIAAYKARVDDPYALYADSLYPGRALSNRTRRAAFDPVLAAPYGETGPVHGAERAVQKALRLALSYGTGTGRASTPPSLSSVAKAYYSRPASRGLWGAFALDDVLGGMLTAGPVRSGADFAAGVDYSVVEERVLAHMQYAAPWRRSKRFAICRICDGGPGNDGPCLCGLKAYGA